MKGLERKILAGVVLGVLVYVLFAAWGDFARVRDALHGFSWSAFGWGLLLASANYVLRYYRWRLYLSELGVTIAPERSRAAFLAGFAMTVTPGKMGELLKAWLLQRSDRVPPATIGAAVFAERLTDVLGLFAVVAAGLGHYAGTLSALGGGDGTLTLLLGIAAVSGLGVVVLSNQRLMLGSIGLIERSPVGTRIGPVARRLYGSVRALLRPRVLLLAVSAAAVAWFLEAYSLHLIAQGFEGARSTPGPCVFIYGATTFLGAFSFVPGGLGVTELSMGILLEQTGQVPSRAAATAATYLIRIATLWFAVLIGVVALAWFRSRYLPVDEPAT
jgi:uncharacterized protein (TIRG00374 family)